MGTITSSVGLISGINTGQIVDELMQIESQPVQVLQTQLDTTNEQQQAYSALATQLGTMQTIGQTLEQPNTFNQSTATSSDTSVLTATAANGAATGTYTLQVAQTVSTQQLISAGFSDSDSTPVGAGTITIDMGGGDVNTPTDLASLNGGTGVAGGSFRITDRDGNSAVIDTATDITLDDVVQQINTATDISVKASIVDNHLVIADTTGKTSGQLSIADTGDSQTAEALGIAGTSTTGTITGTSINYLSSSTSLSVLNDGRGVQSSDAGNDFTVKLSDGTNVNVDLATAKTVGDVLGLINTAGGGKLTAAISTDGSGISLTDTTGTGGMTVTEDNGSSAAAQLGLTTGQQTGGALAGANIVGGIDTTLLSSLNGGAGMSLGDISFTDRAGNTQTIDFSGASTVQDVIDDINNATGVHLTASLKSSGDGIQISDDSGGSGNITIADANGGTGAEQLGIAGTFNTSTSAIQGADLHKQWVTGSTELSTLNGGQGIADGSFTLTNSKGASATITVGSTVTTVGDLIYQINSKDIGVTASINADGNGIQLTDSAGGAQAMSVTDDNGGTTASDLNIAGTATNNTINGAYEKTIAVTATDTLSTVEQKINALGWGVSATVINDGSGTNPYRLSITADNSGTAGRVVVDTGTTNLNTYNLVNAQDAAVFIGSANSASPLLVTSSTNQVSDVVSGVTMNLVGVSANPVTLTIARDPSGITSQISSFVTDFNQLVTAINTLTSYNTTTNQAGLLLGDSTTLAIQSDMYDMLDTVVNTGNANVKTLADVGLTVGDGATLQFDQDTFDQAFTSDPDAVEALFNATTTTTGTDGNPTTQKLGVAYSIDNQIDQLIDPQNGMITIENQGLTSKMTAFQDQIDDLNSQLSDKRNVLQEQFNNMETVLANLQTQQESLSSLTGTSTSSSSSSSSKSST